MNTILAPISIGELIDKITILEIKEQHMTGEKLENVKKELNFLSLITQKNSIDMNNPNVEKLRLINKELWNIEDQIRQKELQQSFGKEFVELARSVYIKNDIRSILKKTINIENGSELIEEKSYESD
tara:strand:- start:69 stop:449 length:381 start_codon:yes stop_codon:yes gene_type:complete